MEEGGAKTHRGARPNQVAMDRGERFRRFVTSKAAAQGLIHDKGIAAAAGVSENTLRNWWKGKGLELGTLVAVADLIGSSVFELLDVWQRDGPPAEVPPDPVASAIVANTDMLKGVLEAILARLPEPNSPVDPALQKEAERDWDGEERRAEQARGGTTSLPRKPSRGRPNAGRSRDRRSTEPTG